MKEGPFSFELESQIDIFPTLFSNQMNTFWLHEQSVIPSIELKPQQNKTSLKECLILRYLINSSNEPVLGQLNE